MSFARFAALVGGHAHELLAIDQTGLIDEKAKRLASAVQAIGKQTGKGLVKRVSRIIGVEGLRVETTSARRTLRCKA